MADRVQSAEAKLRQLETNQTPRRLTGEQKRALVDSLRSFKGHRVDVMRVVMTGKAHRLASDFLESFREVDWDAKLIMAPIEDVPTGIELTVNRADYEKGYLPVATEDLVRVLREVRMEPFELVARPSVPRSVTGLRVGLKPGSSSGDTQ